MANFTLVSTIPPEVESKLDQLLEERVKQKPDSRAATAQPAHSLVPSRPHLHEDLGPPLPGTVLFSAPYQRTGTYHDPGGLKPSGLSASTSGDLEVALYTGGSVEGVAAASVGSVARFQNEGVLTLVANTNLSYDYGCEGADGGTNTYAFIGFYIVAYDTASNAFLGTIVDQRVQLWELHTNHTFQGNEVATINATFTPNSSSTYIIYVQIGARVNSSDGGSARSWANVTVGVPAILW